MMSPYSRLNEVRLEMSTLYMRIAHLRKEVIGCNQQLMTLWRLENQYEQSRELQDRIFGYRIEIEALQARAKQLSHEAARLKQ